MPVYTVHAPVAHGADLAVTDKFVFVRDGFHVWAAVAGALWLAWNRLWLALIGWISLPSRSIMRWPSSGSAAARSCSSIWC